jgi:hypothetical protein
MPAHEREARFHSARLARRLRGGEETAALAQLGATPRAGRRVYALGQSSREVKLRERDFNFALAPAAAAGFLDRFLQQVTERTPLEPPNNEGWRSRMEDVTTVNVVAIDRDRGLIVLDPNRRWPNMLDDLERHGLADLSSEVMLDPVAHDYFTKKLMAALRAIGNPPIARNDPLVRRATGQLAGRGARPTTPTPPAGFLWAAPAMHAARVERSLAPVRSTLESAGFGLNPTQWRAWEEALTRRLQLIWGPPGTGKSRTARAIVVGAALEARAEGRRLRILVCASTYNAMDNVLLPVYADLRGLPEGAAVGVFRLRSYLQPQPDQVPNAIDVELNRRQPSPRALDLRARLRSAPGVTIVGATPEQVHNLLTAADGPAQAELFDLILLDEASQMDVGHAILPLCALARAGALILAGDRKQLPPIHQAEAPRDLEHLVASVYEFFAEFHRIPPVMLDENYRSNATLVDFSREAGYLASLRSYSPDLRLNLLAPLAAERPADWPETLYWTPEWAALLDPEAPAVCFVYEEGRSSQWNAFEADAVVALLWLLQGRLAKQLRNERDPNSGRPLTEGLDASYPPLEFWQKAVGVVTPHRAQQGLIIGRLQRLFGADPTKAAAIRDAVDTVERFQGQQRDVIFASYALGDPDAIATEDEFLMSLNRFNVMASRARAKLIVLVSREVVDHLAGDINVLRESRLLKLYAESFCRAVRPMTLGYLEGGAPIPVSGVFRSSASG